MLHTAYCFLVPCIQQSRLMNGVITFSGCSSKKWFKARALILMCWQAETMEVPRDKITALILSDQFVIKQVPAWYFSDIPSGSHDLVSATTVLNELNSAGIVHMLSQSSRVLQKGGYLYIRDSAKLKPGRHTVNYDKVLVEHLGFELVHWLDVRNRIDMFAIPRLYKKVKQVEIDFASLFDLLLGREAVTSHGGYYAQNLRSDLSDKKLPR